MAREKGSLRVDIDLSPEVSKWLTEVTSQGVMTRKGIANKAIEFVSRCDPTLRAIILGAISEEDQQQAAKMVLERLSKGG